MIKNIKYITVVLLMIFTILLSSTTLNRYIVQADLTRGKLDAQPLSLVTNNANHTSSGLTDEITTHSISSGTMK